MKVYNIKEQKRSKDISHSLATLDRLCNDLAIKKEKLYEEYKQRKLTKEDYMLQKELTQKQVDVLEMEKKQFILDQAASHIEDNQFLKVMLPFTKEDCLTTEMEDALVDMVYIEDREHIKIKLKYEDCCLQTKEFMERYCADI